MNELSIYQRRQLLNQLNDEFGVTEAQFNSHPKLTSESFVDAARGGDLKCILIAVLQNIDVNCTASLEHWQAVNAL